jgi:hypothetical protein
VKTRIPTTVISRTLQAVATFGVVAPSVQIEATQSTMVVGPSHPAEASAAFAGVLTGLSEVQEASTAVSFPSVAIWDSTAEKRFLSLVDREAKDIATTQDIEELERLADLRRRSELPRSGDEVVREYEQHQLIRNLLHSLTRYVEFVGNVSTESSSTRSGTKAKA